MNVGPTGLIQNTWQCYVQRAVLKYYIDTDYVQYCAVLQVKRN